jgi:hypothetical protein
MPAVPLMQGIHNSASQAALPAPAGPPERPHALAGTRARETLLGRYRISHQEEGGVHLDGVRAVEETNVGNRFK